MRWRLNTKTLLVNPDVSLTDALVAMEKAMKRDKITVNDRQLACARITSQEGQDYLKGMAAAGNYAWVNRSSMTFLTRQVNTPAASQMSGGGGVRLTPAHFSNRYSSGLFQSVHHDAGRPGHARHLRRFSQHRQSGGAHGGREAEDAAGPPQRIHPGFPPSPPPHPRRLPGTGLLTPLNELFNRALKVPSHGLLLFPAHRSAGADRRDDGDLQLRPHGDRTGHDGDIRHHLSRSGTSSSDNHTARSELWMLMNWFPPPSVVSGSRSVSSQVPQEPGLPGRPGQTGWQGHRHPSGFTQTGHGGGGSVFNFLSVLFITIIWIFNTLRHRRNCFSVHYKDFVFLYDLCH